MARPVYEWTRPSDGKVFKWSPLSVGEEMDTVAAYRSESMAHMRPVALMALRLRGESGQPLSPTDVREWESDDLGDFMAHAQAKEAERMAAFKKQNGDPRGDLEARVGEWKAKVAEATVALEGILAAARALPL